MRELQILSNPNFRGLTHGCVDQLLNFTLQSYRDSSKLADALLKKSRSIAYQISKIEGVQAVIGTGYPFYIFSPDSNEIVVSDGIAGFIDKVRKKLIPSLETQPQEKAWACFVCYDFNSNTSRTSITCMECHQESLKLHDLLTAMPDIDLHVVVKEGTQEQVQIGIDKIGLVSGNRNIQNTIIQTEQFLQDTLLNKSESAYSPPVDLFILGEHEFCEELHRFPSIFYYPVGENYFEITQSYKVKRYNWQQSTFCLGTDLFLGSRLIRVNDEKLLNAWKMCFNEIAKTVSFERFEECIRDLSLLYPRYKYFFAQEEMKNVVYRNLCIPKRRIDEQIAG